MDKYKLLSVIGEGSYGVVVKCQDRYTGQMVAIKKLYDMDGDQYVKKMAVREIRILQRLRHKNIVNLIEVFKRRGKFYLVFEYLEKTLLNEIENNPNGIGQLKTKEYMFQIVRAVNYCHINNIIHRDIKPENLLVSSNGIVKLCDFGFARSLPTANGCCTEYIATRWYRAPELLVRDPKYGKPIDIWAIGCIFFELLTGDPLFPGDSDIDQLYLIMKLFDKLSKRHENFLMRNSKFHVNEYHNNIGETDGRSNLSNTSSVLRNLCSTWSTNCLNIVASCLILDPAQRITTVGLLCHQYFIENGFSDVFSKELNVKIQKTDDKIFHKSNKQKSKMSNNINNLLTPRLIVDNSKYSNKGTTSRRNKPTICDNYSSSNTTQHPRIDCSTKEKLKIDVCPMLINHHNEDKRHSIIPESKSFMLPLSASANRSDLFEHKPKSSENKESLKTNSKGSQKIEFFLETGDQLKNCKLVQDDLWFSKRNGEMQSTITLPNLSDINKSTTKLNSTQERTIHFKQFC